MYAQRVNLLDWIALRFDGNAEYYRGKTKVQASRLLVVKPTTGR